MINNIETKQFKALYPAYQEFDSKVLTRVKAMHLALPPYLDNSKLVYSLETIYKMLFNKYSNFFARNDDEKQHDLMVNAMQELLPALYLKSLKLSTDALNKLSIDEILSNIQRTYNEDPDNNYASTETTYSSTPKGDDAGSFTLTSPKDKNITNRKDKTVRIKEYKNLLDKYKILGDIDASGLVMAFCNDMAVSSLWRLADMHTVQVIQGHDGADGKSGAEWLTDHYSDITDFSNKAHNYEVVKYNINKDGSNNSEGFVYLIKVGSEVKEIRTWEEAKKFFEAELSKNLTYVNSELAKLSFTNLGNWLKGLNRSNIALMDFDLITGTGNPGGIGDSPIIDIGTLDTQQEREAFLKVAKDETSYHFKFGGEDYEVRTTSVVTDTAVTFRGTRTTTHSDGNEIIEVVRGIITPTLISDQLSSLRVESVIMPFIKPADQYDATEATPVAVTKQLVKDGRSLNDFEEAYGIIGNQIESKYDDTTKEKTWRFGKFIKSNEVFTIGHPMEDGMYVSFYDDFNNWIAFTLHDGFEKHITFKRSILVNGVPTIKQTTATLRVSKINDWDNAWNGAGVPTGTDEGWKVLIFNIKDGQSGDAIIESHVLTPTHMKLDMLAPVVNDVVVEEEAVVPDVPKDFLIDTDNDLGKSSKNKEMALQYNITDSLGNTFLSYNRNSSQIINLPANKTIYDITKISGYTNNKYKWYDVDNEGNLQKRLSYLTLDNHTMFGNGCKIIVENHRSDDHDNLTFTEYLVFEVRPVIENGVMNIHKLHLTNKGIITGGGDNTLKVLVDNSQDPNTEIAQAAHIHYINIWFRGGA